MCGLYPGHPHTHMYTCTGTQRLIFLWLQTRKRTMYALSVFVRYSIIGPVNYFLMTEHRKEFSGNLQNKGSAQWQKQPHYSVDKNFYLSLSHFLFTPSFPFGFHFCFVSFGFKDLNCIYFPLYDWHPNFSIYSHEIFYFYLVLSLWLANCLSVYLSVCRPNYSSFKPFIIMKSLPIQCIFSLTKHVYCFIRREGYCQLSLGQYIIGT